MRPPEGMKDWFDKLEEEQLAMLDRPGGWNRRSRRYRFIFAILTTVLLVAMPLALAVLADDAAALVAVGVVVVPMIVWIWIMAVDPTKGIRIANSRGKRKHNPSS